MTSWRSAVRVSYIPFHLKKSWILSILNRTAAEIAAAALCELFPDVELWGGGETSLGFFYDFYFPHPMSPEPEVLLSERMRQIARERRPIRTLEMVPQSAKQFLMKAGRSSRVNDMDEQAFLIEMIEMGSFIDLSSGPHLKNSHELSAFKLWPLERIEKGGYRLTGCAKTRKDELNLFLKRLRSYQERSHMWVGEKKSLWSIWQGKVLWLQEGLKGKRETLEFLRSHLFKNCLEVSWPSLEDRVALHAALAEKMKQRPLHLAEIYQTPCVPWDPDSGLFTGEGGEQIQISSYLASSALEQALISSLQLVGKTLNILGFKYSLRLSGQSRSEKGFQKLLKTLECLGEEFEVYCIELQEKSFPQIGLFIEDNLGRKWAGFSWHLVQKGFYVIGSIERLYALLLERSI